MQAFELAVEAGSQRIELDVQLTADGHAAILHDDQLQKMTGHYGLISTMTRQQLSTVKLLNGESVPFLDQVVERFLHRIELNIEIKGPSEKLAAAVAHIVARHPLAHKILISSFCWQPLVWCMHHMPAIPRACLWSSDSWSWPFFANMAPPLFLERCGTKILHPHIALVNENLMDQAKARNWIVYPWVGMQEEEGDREGLWSAMKTYGVDGLCTNYPRQLKSWLADAQLDEQVYRESQSL